MTSGKWVRDGDILEAHDKGSNQPESDVGDVEHSGCEAEQRVHANPYPATPPPAGQRTGHRTKKSYNGHECTEQTAAPKCSICLGCGLRVGWVVWVAHATLHCRPRKQRRTWSPFSNKARVWVEDRHHPQPRCPSQNKVTPTSSCIATQPRPCGHPHTVDLSDEKMPHNPCRLVVPTLGQVNGGLISVGAHVLGSSKSGIAKNGHITLTIFAYTGHTHPAPLGPQNGKANQTLMPQRYQVHEWIP